MGPVGGGREQLKDEGGRSTAPGLEGQLGGRSRHGWRAGQPQQVWRVLRLGTKAGPPTSVCEWRGAPCSMCLWSGSSCARESVHPAQQLCHRPGPEHATNDPLLGTEAPGCGRWVPGDQRELPRAGGHDPSQVPLVRVVGWRASMCPSDIVEWKGGEAV